MLPTPGHGRAPPRVGIQPITNRFMDELLTLPTPGHGRPPPKTNRFVNELLTLPTPGYSRLPPSTGTQPVIDRSMCSI